FIFISSSAAYGRGPTNERASYDTQLPICAYTATHPRNVYAAYKLAVESLVTGYKYDHGMSGNVNLRPAGPLGLFGFRCYDTEGMLSQEIIDAMSGQEVTINLPSEFSAIDGYDIGRACVELIAKNHTDGETVEDICLYANSTINPSTVHSTIQDVFGTLPLNMNEEISKFTYQGDDVNIATTEFNSDSTLRRHLLDLKMKLEKSPL
ncbi:MAG: NAD-dependent epimerase/dehydratase family protein, partial [Planctomycetes bacterium]|nr:NAD-dependent epimerase/dehydratase family protein [Planctomycetota bacterium]